MLESNENKILAGHIAARYCLFKTLSAAGKARCRVAILIRLNFFNDNNFLKGFLPYISRSQFFVFTRTVVEINQDESQVFLDGYDIITEANKSLNVIVPYYQIGMNDILRVLNKKQRSDAFYTSLGKVGKYFVVRLDGVGNNYPNNIKSYIPPLPKRIMPDPPVGPPVGPPEPGETGYTGEGGEGGEGEDSSVLKKLLIPALLAAAYFFMG